jgi:molecular chaperone Hsp33
MYITDTSQRFLFEYASIRGEIIHLDNTYRAIIEQRPYPTQVKRLLGEAMLSVVLLAGSLKFEGEISIQFHGDKRLPLMTVICNDQLQLRAVAKYQTDEDNVDYDSAFLNGKMVLNISQLNQTQVYQSVVPIKSASMAENLMHYFAQSEQIPSQVCLAVSQDGAAGMILQLMPEQDSLHREKFWEYAVHLGQTITNDELITLDNATILHRLYHETVLRLFDERPVIFKCSCSLTKMKQVLNMLGESDVRKLLKEKGQVEVNCDFCNKNYLFDEIDVTLLFRKV